MRFAKLKLFSASVLFLLGSQTANAQAETSATTQQASDATAGSTETATKQTPPVYRGYRPPRHYRGHRRGWVRPFGDDGPTFRPPWKKGRGSGFGFGSGSGPSWDSGPRFRSFDDRDRDRFFDDPFMDDPFDDPFYDRGPRFYDRGPRFYDRGPRDWDWDSNGMSFGW